MMSESTFSAFALHDSTTRRLAFTASNEDNDRRPLEKRESFEMKPIDCQLPATSQIHNSLIRRPALAYLIRSTFSQHEILQALEFEVIVWALDA